MIRIENVSLSYRSNVNEIVVFNQLSLSIDNGQWISIVGPSGSGKTSLLKLIGGQLKPDKGKVFIDNIDLYRMKEKQKQTSLFSKIGFVYQQFRLLPQFSVLENVMLPLIPYEKKKIIEEKAITIIKKLDLHHRLNHLPKELSGGEQQRVAFARALLTNPKILICDEPTGNLDPRNRDNIMELLKQLHQQGHTIIVATHDEVVANHGQRIFKLTEHQIVEREISYD